ncbi:MULTISPECIES: GntR family transcriptional regulator [unclassified Novosphingobium]|uniref:GntR family transcriptional regulator n=1 Tax=Novosphingobium TaxID=165696 RepID=UPI0014459956|nr:MULTISPECIES: GntR family transcriptional regulator [unclassified Novosphingobium]NKJ43414.1 DNA-binding GntR family transcriptional regulator [Novosphingobium sp. SG720]NMN06892.1 DNA-binding GntR family transcriptional regulator [Novosphingobium sp. SG919]NMN89521.1 DNA-binding GntR family transcriptional regulator [Novosphingobium sp. SG916]
MKIGATTAKGQAKAATGKAAASKPATPKGVAKAPVARVARATKAAGAKAAAAKADEGEVTSSLREQVYEDLRYRLITGKIAPGVGISTRGLAQQMGVSQMPVRDALSRIAAEGAVDIRSKRAVMVPKMTLERFDEIMRLRTLLEPVAAVAALPHIDAERLRDIRAADEATDAALGEGDVNAYMESNFRFHSLIYGAAPMPLANRMIESLWMQFGPFMRVVYGRYGTAAMVDHHQAAAKAIAKGDAQGLHDAIAGDIGDCADLMQDWDRLNL